MEIKQEQSTQKSSKKKRASAGPSNAEEPIPKKPKLYSVKQFRKQLSHTTERLDALKGFSSILKNNPKHDYILDYLTEGGNCLELLQTLEGDSSIPPSIVFDLITYILLGITAKHGQYFNSAYESCRYLINNYLPVVHKMLGLSSSKEERKVCLKLLTAMAAFSSNLARDILLNVKFHSANLELLTKPTGEKNSVRDSFIHFLTSFLVDADWHTLSVLLDKSFLLTSVIPGLQHDDCDTVCLVITAMKNYILEHPSVMKTTKMHVFNTAVVKDIVNLYNWKGLEGLKALDKTKKSIAFEIDKVAKSKVSECVHDFLLVLCTSYKHGVIFRDPLVGLGRKNMNPLMYTVLNSLDRPWDHSYASDLVIRICKSCPDLTKNMWLILKPYLEPRLTEKWLSAIKFANKLIDTMEPECIDYCAKDLSPHQLAAIIEILTSPYLIIKILLEVTPEEKTKVATYIIQLFCRMLEQLSKFISKSKAWTSSDNVGKLTQMLALFVGKHFPKAEKLLEDWTTVNLSNNEGFAGNLEDNLKSVLQLVSLYKSIAPQLLSSLTSTTSFDFKDFLFKLSSLDDIEESETLQIKLVGLFVDTDQSFFLPTTDIFSRIIPILLRHYHEHKQAYVEDVLIKLLKNTGIFEGNNAQTDIWLNGLFNFTTITDSFVKDFLEVFKGTLENLLEYQKEISEMTLNDDRTTECQDFIEQLLNITDNDQEVGKKLRHQLPSPALLGILNYLKENSEHSKNSKKYLEAILFNIFHCQTTWPKDRLVWFRALLEKHSEVVPLHILNYVRNWVDNQPCPLIKVKGSLDVFKDAGDGFLNGKLTETILKQPPYPGFAVDLLRMATFYFSNLVAADVVSELHCKNWAFLLDYIADNSSQINKECCWEIALENISLIDNFSLLNIAKAKATETIFKVFKNLSGKGMSVDCYKQHYSNKIFQDIKKFLRKPEKHQLSDATEDYLKEFQLSYKQCTVILSHISQCSKDSHVIFKLIVYCLGRVAILCKQQADLGPIHKSVLQTLSSRLDTQIAAPLKQYLEVFPHAVADIDQELFTKLLTMSDYNKECVDLVIFIVERDLSSTVSQIQTNSGAICEKKGLVLPLLQVLLRSNVPDDLLETIYVQLEASILKALQKPQKVGQHFLKDHNIAPLIDRFMPVKKCISFCDKVHKFEVSEVFHAKLMEACFSKAIDSGTLSTKQIGHFVLTFLHLNLVFLKRKLDSDEDFVKIDGLSQIFIKVLDKIVVSSLEIANESLKSYCKLALKYGVSGRQVLLQILVKLLKIVKFEDDDASILLDMLTSHSEFLNVVLGEVSDTKLGVLRLFLELCQRWNGLMDKSHMAVLLSAYRGMVTRCDRAILALLKLFESKPEQTKFYDFKPFLIGRAAATHYSVRSQIASSLNRQPKISDVLGVLKEDVVNTTVTHYPLTGGLSVDSEEDVQDLNCYDLKFFLPLFSHILAPEQQVKTYVFIRSGALSLTILSLACEDKEMRLAACHVLSRLHFHLEARQSGKDNLLWIRYVEALCKGVALLPDFKLNSFSAIFFARTAFVLTNPKHVLFPSLSLYLTSKEDLDFSTIPELYTHLFSSDVHFRDFRQFILEVIRDGLKTEKDFLDFERSMAFKLFSELFSSCLSDPDCRSLILDVVNSACKISLGIKMLIENHSLLSQLDFIVNELCTLKEYKNLTKTFEIFLNIIKSGRDGSQVVLIFELCLQVLLSGVDIHFSKIPMLYELLFKAWECNNYVIRDKSIFVDKLCGPVNDRFCNYLRKFGCTFVSEKCEELTQDHKLHYLRLLIYRILLS